MYLYVYVMNDVHTYICTYVIIYIYIYAHTFLHKYLYRRLVRSMCRRGGCQDNNRGVDPSLALVMHEFCPHLTILDSTSHLLLVVLGDHDSHHC